ncbi:MAG: ferrochelatase [Candidatus Dormibacteria bacterium]
MGTAATSSPDPTKLNQPGRSRAVLLMAYGSPRSASEILPYFTHMRGGTPPAAPALAELVRRYQAIGGSSPLQQITAAQAGALEEELRRRDGTHWRVVVGMKHSAPFLEDAAAELRSSGVAEAVALVLAPHYSVLSVGDYVGRVRAALAGAAGPPQIHFITDWHLFPGYVRWLATRVRRQLAELGAPWERDPLVIFTAHSLPARLREMGDPYPGQLAETATAVAQEAGLRRWTVAWQSVARTGEPWLGPELLEVVREEAGAGTREFLVCACGFTADHLEILYDLDLEARTEAARLGVRLVRTAMPNADPEFVAALADLVQAELAATP